MQNSITGTSSVSAEQNIAVQAARLRRRKWLLQYLPFFSTPIALLLLVGLWQLYTATDARSKYIIPAPALVWDQIVNFPNDPKFVSNTWQTIYETLLGFAFATLVGVVLGFIVAKSVILERILNPFIIASQVVPKIALAPLFILIWGFNSIPNVVTAVLLSFFPLLSNVVLGVKSVEEGKHDLMNSLGAGWWSRIWHVELPFSLPYILTGMEVGIILALIGAVVGEYLNPNGGLGAVIVQSLNAFQLDKLYAAIVILTIIGFICYALLVGARRFLIPWHETGQTIRRETM
jgi:NitT/TauT family transport system permease protein